ncbi:MAG: prephenate dehydrogenase/arogenate dehydrogenase family protein, partial [Candidatus Brocadiia bacterium]
NTVLTDVASTKVNVVECASQALRGRPDIAFVPAHPIAGSEQRGPLAAEPDLFEGSVCILTPMTNTFPDTKRAVMGLWQSLGARTVSMTPQAHDRLVARISHLPHMAAVALMALVDPDEAELSGGGLRDTTRVASGDPDLWREICRANSGPIREALVDLIAVLKDMAGALQKGDMDAVHRMLTHAKQKRDSTIASHPGEGQ